MPVSLSDFRGKVVAVTFIFTRCTDTCLSLGVPIVSVIIGEGGSGGAVAIAKSVDVVATQPTDSPIKTP